MMKNYSPRTSSLLVCFDMGCEGGGEEECCRTTEAKKMKTLFLPHDAAPALVLPKTARLITLPRFYCLS